MQQIIVKDLHSNDEEVLKQALSTLCIDISEDDSQDVVFQNEFYRHGGHAAVVNVMKKHRGCQDIQDYAIGVIANATFRNDEVKTAITTVGGVEAILAAMQQFCYNYSIQRNAVISMSNLVWNCDDSQHPETLVVDAGGLFLLLDVMNRYHHDEDIVLKCCEILARIALCDESRKAVFDTDALTALAKARDRYKTNGAIEEYVGLAMKGFFLYSSEGRELNPYVNE